MGNICSDSCLEVVETRDFKELKKLVLHKDIVSDFLSKNNEDFESKIDNNKIIFYLLRIDGFNCGFVAFVDVGHLFNSEKIFFPDIGIIKNFRGKLSYKLAKIALDKFMNEVVPNKLFAKIRADNKKSIYFALKTGFKILKHDDKNYFLEVIWAT
jgi:Acetyltransferases, including N-acetylases of ribosomal proteins